MEVVAERGWDAVTTRAIARRAGANQALINYHFRSKEDLLRTAVRLALRGALEEPVRLLLAAPTLAEGAAELVRILGTFDGADPIIRFSMEALARAPRDPEVRAEVAELLAELRAQLERRIAVGQQRGELAEELDASGLAIALSAAFDGLGLHLLIDPTLDLERTASAVRSLLSPPKETR